MVHSGQTQRLGWRQCRSCWRPCSRHGGYVPMIAGRGLAHTGGTIDKLEAIPGYQTGVSIAHFQKVVETHGFSIVRQTDELAPADRRMYATRDVTARSNTSV